MSYHESLDTYELIDDGFDAEQDERDQWAERVLSTLPDVSECDGCDRHVTSAQGSFVPGLPDGEPMVSPGHRTSGFFCPSCAEVMGEAGWFRW